MGKLGIYLVFVVLCLGTYTMIVGLNHGWNLMPIFIRDIAAMMVLALYLFFASIEANGDVKVLMLGSSRAIG